MLGRDEDVDAVAVLARSQSRDPFDLTFGELRDQVARARAGLQRLGVGPGDRVVAYLPNIPETLVAFLAAASLGAVWATCPPEFGPRSVLDRLGQLEPKRAARRRRLHLGRGEDRPPRAGRRGARRAPVACSTVIHVAYGGNELPDARPVGRARRRARPARVRPGPVRPPAVRPLLVGDDRAAEGDRPRARRHPDRAPQEPRPLVGPAPGRPADVVHDDRLDDVERARLDAAAAGVDRDDRRQPRLPRPLRAVADDRGDAGRRCSGLSPAFTMACRKEGLEPGPRLRPLDAEDDLRRRLAAPARTRTSGSTSRRGRR